jgi:hypothetical protein
MPPPKISDLEIIFTNLVKFAIGFAAIVLFVLILIAGFKFITAGDNPKAAESAKMTLTYAIGGLFLIFISYLILVLIANITGANILGFSVTH